MKNNKINVYIAKEDRKKLDEIKVKNQLSLTAIVDILIEITYDCLKLNCNEETMKKITNMYVYQRGNKTSIKIPRSYKRNTMYETVDKSRFASNCLNIYLKKEINIFIKNKDILEGKYGYWNRINQEMKNRHDPKWQYNENLRNQVNIVKQNKEYFKKILGE